MIQVQPTPGGTVVAFRAAGHKTRRPAASVGEGRGVILLFTGIRYERTDEASLLAASAQRAEAGKQAAE